MARLNKTQRLLQENSRRRVREILRSNDGTDCWLAKRRFEAARVAGSVRAIVMAEAAQESEIVNGHESKRDSVIGAAGNQTGGT